jgi:hypothetical protein
MKFVLAEIKTNGTQKNSEPLFHFHLKTENIDHVMPSNQNSEAPLRTGKQLSKQNEKCTDGLSQN